MESPTKNNNRETFIFYFPKKIWKVLAIQDSWWDKKENGLIKVVVNLRPQGSTHRALIKLNEICIAAEMYEKNLKKNWDKTFEAETKDQREDDGSGQSIDENKELDRLMSDVGKERYDLSMRD